LDLENRQLEFEMEIYYKQLVLHKANLSEFTKIKYQFDKIKLFLREEGINWKSSLRAIDLH